MRPLLVILTIVIALISASAQNYSRPINRRAVTAVEVKTPEAINDTIVPSTDSISVAGFEKTLRNMYETMFITNRTSRPVIGMTLQIDYLDMTGRQLHQAIHDISTDIPAGETRRIEVRAFDRSALFYYHLSPKPTRAAQATPFDVKVKVLFIIHPKLTSPTQ